jgi:long-chain alkane monooxygenase
VQAADQADQGAEGRRFIIEVTEGLVPALQRRGLMRTAYSGRTLLEVLAEH